MREVTLQQKGEILDPAVRAALQEIETASHENVINDVGAFGLELVATETVAEAQALLSEEDGDTLGFATAVAAAAASIPTGVTIVRTAGKTTVDDGLGATYQFRASEPTGPGKFQTANGRWFEIIYNPLTFTPGLVHGGVVANDAAVTAALAARPTPGRRYLSFGPGSYYFADNITITLADNESLAIRGVGIDVSILRFAPGKGIVINYSAGSLDSSTVTVCDMTIATEDTNGGNTGLKLYLSTGTNQGAGTATTLSNLSFRGIGDFDVEGNQYWETAIDVWGVNKVNFYNCWFYSVLNTATNRFDLGVGVYFHGNAGYSAVEYNMANCAWVDVGFGIVWGSTVENSVEGLTMSGCNMVGGKYGIYSPPNINPTTQICITNSHFNCQDNSIWLRSVCASLLITNTLFIASIMPTGGSCIVLKDEEGTGAASCDLISNCHFYADGTGKEGIVLDGINGASVIGNTFLGFATLSVASQGASQNILCAHNHYLSSATFANTSAFTSTIWQGLKATTIAPTTPIASP